MAGPETKPVPPAPTLHHAFTPVPPPCSHSLFYSCLALLGISASAQFGPKPANPGGSTVTTPHVQAELVAHAPQGVGPGQPLWLGLPITHQPDWHTYWKNPGDSGLPTELTWQLPAGLDAATSPGPLPHKIAIGTLANYGYEGTVLLPVPVTVTQTFAPWPIAPRTLPCSSRPHGWCAARNASPKKATSPCNCPSRAPPRCTAPPLMRPRRRNPSRWQNRARNSRPRSMAMRCRCAWPACPPRCAAKRWTCSPKCRKCCSNAAPGTQQWEGDVWTARIPLAEQRSNSPSTLPVVLAERVQGSSARAPGTGPI